MFVRRLKSKNSKVYIQVVDKSSDKYRVIKSFDGATSQTEEAVLVSKAEDWIRERTGLREIDFSNIESTLESLVDSISSLKRVGYELLLGRIFDEIGFNRVQDDLFRELVIGRIAFPKSKLKTREYLYRFKGIDYSEDQIYRYLDKLHSKQKELVQEISYQHTKKILNNTKRDNLRIFGSCRQAKTQ